MLLATTGLAENSAENVMDAAQLQLAQKADPATCRSAKASSTRYLHWSALADPARRMTASLAAAIAWGPGPRASQALMLTCRARALLQGRVSPSIDDIIALAPAVLRHRMALNFAARADGLTDRFSVIDRLCARLGVMTATPPLAEGWLT